MVQASLDFLFYARRTSNSHHKRYSYSLLGPGTLTAHRRFHLVLLHSCPDTVHGVLLRKTQTSTSLIEGSFAMKKPSIAGTGHRYLPGCALFSIRDFGGDVKEFVN